MMCELAKTFSARLGTCAAAMALAAATCAPADAALRHHYIFDEVGSSTVTDLAGNADGTLSGDAAITANGLELNLTDGGARDGLVSLLTSATDAANGIDVGSFSELTVEFWATPSSALNNSFSTAVGFGKVNTTNADLAAEYFIMQTHRGDDRSQTALSFSDDGDPWTEEEFATGPELNDDAPHRYRAVVTASDISLFVDDMQNATGSNPLVNNALANVANEFAWIGDAYPADQNWAGTITELRIYDTAIPEPNTVVLLGLAGVGLACSRRLFA